MGLLCQLLRDISVYGGYGLRLPSPARGWPSVDTGADDSIGLLGMKRGFSHRVRMNGIMDGVNNVLWFKIIES